MRDDPWLAARLGRPVLTFEPGDDPAAVAAAAADRAPAFAQAKVACDDVATVGALETAGFRVVDVNVTLSHPGGGAPAGGEVSDAAPGDRDAVLDIAVHHFGVSRFHRDPAVDLAAAAAIKRDWAAAYLDGERGERLLVARRDGAVAGFLAILATGDGTRVIDLIAVRSDLRSSGAGGTLVGALLASAPGRVDVGTQVANLGAIRFYERLGFTLRDSRYVLHLHAAAGGQSTTT